MQKKKLVGKESTWWKKTFERHKSEVGITSLSIHDAATLFYSLEAPLLLIVSSSRGVPGTAKIFYNIY